MSDNQIIVSHTSALSFWMRTDEAAGNMPERCALAPLDESASASLEDEKLVVADGRFGEKPLHLLTARKGSSLHNESLFRHYSSIKLPRTAFRRVNDRIAVCAPWLCLAQSATIMSEAEIARAMTDVSGNYYLSYDGALIGERGSALTTVARIQSQLAAHANVHGARIAAHAAKWALDNSGSPRETAIMLLLCMPVRMGGYGLPAPVMNMQISPGRLRKLVDQNWFVGDLCWPNSHVIVEYNGTDYHLDRAHDNRRRNDLEALGWQVVFVYKDTVDDFREFDLLARKLSRALGHRLRRPASWHAKHIALRMDLGLATYRA